MLIDVKGKSGFLIYNDMTPGQTLEDINVIMEDYFTDNLSQ